MGKNNSSRKSMPSHEFSISKAVEVSNSNSRQNLSKSVVSFKDNIENLKPNGSKAKFLQDDHGSLTNHEGSSNVAEDASISNNVSEYLQEEDPEECFDSYYPLSETEMNNETMEEIEEVPTSSFSGAQGHIVDIVDRSDANYVQLYTDSFRIELSKLPLISSLFPDSETEDGFELKSNSLNSDDSDAVEPIASAKSEHILLADKVEAPVTFSERSETKTKRDRRKTPATDTRENGNFVNPLTGSFVQETVVEEDTVEEITCLEEAFEDMSHADSEEIASETGSSIEYLDLQERKISLPQEENESNLLDFFRENKANATAEAIVKVKDLEVLAKKTALAEKIEQFLDDIIDQVVKFVEHEDELLFLRRRLDKTGLFKAIKEAVLEYYSAESYRNFLEQTAVKYFRRRKIFGHITPDKTDIEARYLEVRNWLDKLLGDEICIREKIKLRENELEEEKLKLEEMCRMEKSMFEQLVKNTVKRDEMPRLEEFVKRELRRIQMLNELISAVREKLLKTQHIHGTLKARINVYEYKGDNFCLADYENLLRQNFYLEKKIEERNGDLSKATNRLRRNLHILAHLNLHNGIYTNELKANTQKLDFMVSQGLDCRTDLYRLKLERTSIQRRFNEISLLSGLVDKPILLKDYDQTLEKIEEKRRAVDELKQLQKRLEQRISHLGKARTTK